jgi:hypothetical protein
VDSRTTSGLLSTVHAGPMAFAVDGRQHIAIAAGNAILAFALPE